MTGNSAKINKLRNKQIRRKKRIERYKKRARKHIFLITLPFIAYALINLDNAFKEFGSVSNFLSIVGGTLATFIAIYLVAVYYMIKQEKREINIIRSKIYKLMKLNND